MVRANKVAPPLVDIRVELFGLARMLSGRHHVEVPMPRRAETVDVVAALARACPELVGKVLLEDVSGLQESYTLNLNGTSFVGDERLHLEPGDTLLLFSSQAGG